MSALLTLLSVNRLSLLIAREHQAGSPLVTDSSLVYVPDRRSTRLMFLGYDQAAADVVWLQAIQYLGRNIHTQHTRWLETLVDRAIELDRNFRRVYMWAGALVMYGRTFSNANIRQSNRFYQAALQQFPDSYEPAYRLGINYYIELHAANRAEKRKFREIGLSYFERAANAADAPNRIKSLVAGVSSKLGRKDIRCNYLREVYLSTSIESARTRLLSQITAVGCNEKTERSESLKTFAEIWRQNYPYTEAGLFGLLGEPDRKPVADVRWQTLMTDYDLGAATAAPTETH